MLKRETKAIGDHQYTAIQMPPTQAIPIGIRVLKMVTPGLSKIDGDLINEIKDKGVDSDASSLLPAIEALLKDADPDRAMDLIKKLICGGHVQKNGCMISDIDAEFMDCPMDIFKVAGMVINVNFKSFFPGSGSFAELLNKTEVAPEKVAEKVVSQVG